ncbi:hypothetical protein G7072_16610 [Nocardioides sp. HDW12B]|uniref:hypothetical protein n=1 Tax=Nocardioides sp. HDW12B TaxID=2714939 RepID=UPI001409E71F|nr:hypothetical protein [Nocardioides sp. HDW12B]QIK67751.1 hypothetical protein G7072_16610 [Nocardioides sp. HDW12B]
MELESALTTTSGAAVVTIVVGAAMTAAPGPVGALCGIDDRRLARLVGISDAVCATGLLAGRPRWPWATARAGLNLVQAAILVRRGTAGTFAAIALVGLTVVDGAAARELHRAGR